MTRGVEGIGKFCHPSFGELKRLSGRCGRLYSIEPIRYCRPSALPSRADLKVCTTHIRRHSMTRSLTIAMFALGTTVAVLGQPGPGSASFDWPQWQGPDRTNVSKETGLLKQWPANGPPRVWSIADLGAGYGSIAVKSDR